MEGSPIEEKSQIIVLINLANIVSIILVIYRKVRERETHTYIAIYIYRYYRDI